MEMEHGLGWLESIRNRSSYGLPLFGSELYIYVKGALWTVQNALARHRQSWSWLLNY
jgi:hypothetical protein